MATRSEAPTIETERLKLRRLTDVDVPALLALFTDAEVRWYLAGYPPNDERTVLGVVRHRRPTDWGVTLKRTDEIVGHVLIPRMAGNVVGDIGYLFKK